MQRVALPFRGDSVVKRFLELVRQATLAMKGGRLYDGTTLDQTWPEKKPFGEPYWSNPDASRTDVRSLTPQ